MKNKPSKVAIVTGASSGFGEAIARELAKHNIHLILGARRVDRLRKLAAEIQKNNDIDVIVEKLDVQSTASVHSFVSVIEKKFRSVDYLINNAGLSLGLDKIENSVEEHWKTIWETNVMGVVRLTQKIIPLMKSFSGSRIVNIGSVAGLEAYEGGATYSSSKFALRAVTQTLRFELLEKGIGVTSVDPGMAETEFSMIRFDGDEARAKKVYEGLEPLHAQDVAEVVAFVLSRPDHVNVDQLVVMPTAQAMGKRVNRNL